MTGGRDLDTLQPGDRVTYWDPDADPKPAFVTRTVRERVDADRVRVKAGDWGPIVMLCNLHAVNGCPVPPGVRFDAFAMTAKRQGPLPPARRTLWDLIYG